MMAMGSKGSLLGGFLIVAVDGLLILVILSQFPLPQSLFFVLPLAILEVLALMRLIKSLK